MLSSLADEESSYLCNLLCTLLKLGISVTRGSVSEFYEALSELDEFLITLDGEALIETNYVLEAIFTDQNIEDLFHQAAVPLLKNNGSEGSAVGLNDMYSLAEELLECLQAGGTSEVFAMIKI